MYETEKFTRGRSENFSREESLRLINIVVKHRTVLECKESNAQSWRQKCMAWVAIEKEYNLDSGGSVYRNRKSLKMRYDSIRRSIKSKLSKAKLNGSADAGLDVVEQQLRCIVMDQNVEQDNSFNNNSLESANFISDPLQNSFNESLQYMVNVAVPIVNFTDVITPDVKPSIYQSLNVIPNGHPEPLQQQHCDPSPQRLLPEPLTNTTKCTRQRKMYRFNARKEKIREWLFKREERMQMRKEWKFKEKEREEKLREWTFRELEREEFKKEAAFRERERAALEKHHEVKLKIMKLELNDKLKRFAGL